MKKQKNKKNMLHRAYYTPHRMSATHSPQCWRCTHQPGEFVHIFWTWSAIQLHWQEVLQVIIKVMGSEILSVGIGGAIVSVRGQENTHQHIIFLCSQSHHTTLEAYIFSLCSILEGIGNRQTAPVQGHLCKQRLPYKIKKGLDVLAWECHYSNRKLSLL